MSRKIDFDYTVTLSYKPLWKLLVDLEMNKQELKRKAKLSATTMSRLNTGENLTTDVLLRICQTLNCQLSDIATVLPKQSKEER